MPKRNAARRVSICGAFNMDYGHKSAVPNQREADSREYSEAEKARIAHNRKRVVLGAPETVKSRLLALREPVRSR